MELGSAGVSISLFNIISKLFNIPLLSVATSFVAEDIAKNASSFSMSGRYDNTRLTKTNLFIKSWFIKSCKSGMVKLFECLGILFFYEEDHSNGRSSNNAVEKVQLSSVSTALVLAVGIGIFEATALIFGAGPLLSLMGISPVWNLNAVNIIIPISYLC